MSTLPRPLLRLLYEKCAQEYLNSLPPEHFMEAIAQGTQRAITLASLALVQAQRPEFQVFNELLVQYPVRGQKKPKQVVPDNMVVVHPEPIQATGSYDMAFQPCRPFWVLEYVSKNNERKDYEESFEKYERELKVPYCLMFYPDNQCLSLFRHNGRKYISVKPNKLGRLALSEVDMEVALLDGWVRFWYRGELLPLPADLQRELTEERQRRLQAEQRAADATQRAADATQRAADATQRAADAERRMEEERQARLALEQEVARLRAQAEGRWPKKNS